MDIAWPYKEAIDVVLEHLTKQVVCDECQCGTERIGETKLWCCNDCGKRCEKF